MKRTAKSTGKTTKEKPVTQLSGKDAEAIGVLISEKLGHIQKLHYEYIESLLKMGRALLEEWIGKYTNENLLQALPPKEFSILIETLLDLMRTQRVFLQQDLQAYPTDGPEKQPTGKQFIHLPGIDINAL